MPVRVVLRHDGEWRLFEAPHRVIQATTTDEVIAAMREVEAAVTTGQHAAGLVCYEAAGGFDAALQTLPCGRLPLVWFGLFESFEVVPAPVKAAGSEPLDWLLATNLEDYRQRLLAIRDALADGRSYQVNHTERLHVDHLDAVSLFAQVASDAPYAALIQTETFTIVSASPELFFDLCKTNIVCKPMKGTVARALTSTADRERARWLSSSIKNRAENVMITDMVRNDLGRIARVGSVRVTDLFAVQRLRNVWQMTSTVSATTDVSITQIFQALFPGASVTGAPKASSMSIIRTLESTAREIYTGAIGHMGPDRHARFSIAIRTAWTDRVSPGATYGAGGGIVWDSNPDEEFAELLAKTNVVRAATEPVFHLLETLLWTPGGGWFLLRQHLDRLSASAEYFSFQFDELAVVNALDELVETADAARRVRLTLGRTGEVEVNAQALVPLPSQVADIHLVRGWVDASDVLMYHKTTHRVRYETAGAGSEVLLVNATGSITESTIANVVYSLRGQRYTPPVEDGLLPGTFRAWMLELGIVLERSLDENELSEIDELLLVNGLRGVRKVERVLTPEGKVLFERSR
jgi:para-aminobenzoate synthetase / 4-amino-4-deoxychorismate lyase